MKDKILLWMLMIPTMTSFANWTGNEKNVKQEIFDNFKKGYNTEKHINIFQMKC